MEPFAALMRTYCIDYTNSHDISVCDSIMEPDYVVRICGMALERDTAYKPSVETVFKRYPALGLVVHELVTNGDRLAMRFSEHGASSRGPLACWAGIGLYRWNGTRLTECRVEQDFWSQQRQLTTGVPDPLEPPHLDPWLSVTAQAPNADAEATVRRWLAAGNLADADDGRIDEGPLSGHDPVVTVTEAEVLDLFSAGDRVAFHATLRGPYTGTLPGVDGAGREAAIDIAGLVRVAGDRITDARVVTDRLTASTALSQKAPAP